MKRQANDDLLDEGVEAVAGVGQFGGDAIDDGFVGALEAAAEGVDQELFGEAAEERLAAVKQQLFEFAGAVEFSGAGQSAGGVDGCLAIEVAPFADGIKIFEAEAEGIHAAVATGTGGILAMGFHLHAEGEAAIALGLLKRGDGRGRRRGRRVEEIFEDPAAAQNRGGAGGVTGSSEHAGMGEDAAAAPGGGHVDATEFGPDDAGNAIEACQAFIEKGVRSRQDVGDAAIVADEIEEEEGGFLLHGMAQAFIEVGELFDIGLHGVDVAVLKPLASEIINESAGALVLEHAADLSAKGGGLAEGTEGGEAKERGVGGAAPEKVAETGGEFVVADGSKILAGQGGAILLDAEEEMGTDEDGLEGGGNAFGEGIAGVSGQGKNFQEGSSLTWAQRAAEGIAGKGGDNALGAGRGLLAAGENLGGTERGGAQLLGERAADVHRFEAVIDADFSAVGLELGTVFAQEFDVAFGELAARGTEGGDILGIGGIGPVVLRGKALIDVEVGGAD